MSTQSSPWRRRARRTIDEVLAALPPGATEKERRKAVRDAYPFGEREHHPYRMWLAEVRLTFPKSRPAETVSEPRFAIALGYLVVDCGWCEDALPPGCMVCLRMRDAVRRVTALPDWPGWREALAAGDPVAPLALADRLAEAGEDGLAEFFRAGGSQ